MYYDISIIPTNTYNDTNTYLLETPKEYTESEYNLLYSYKNIPMKFLNLFYNNDINIWIEIEELKNTYYINNKFIKPKPGLYYTENKEVLFFIDCFLEALEKLEYTKNINYYNKKKSYHW